jgi:lipopolysaccharide export system protein LptA
MSIGLFFAVLFVAGLTAAAAASAAETPAARPDTAAGASAAAAADPAKKAAEPQPPVRISADAAEYFNKEGLVVFTGNVVAVQADSTISSERMDVSFEKTASAEGKAPTGIGTPATAQRITMIVAEEKVSFRQVDPETKKERYATGDKGVYDVDQRRVTMSGNPRLWEGKNVIVGDEMIFYLEDKKVIVKGKVNLTVYPDDLKEGKKP